MTTTTAPQPDRIEIQRFEHDHLGDVVRIHRAAFTQGALTLLGPGVVRRYYLTQFRQPGCRSWVAFDRGRMLGFVVGGVLHGSLSGFLQRHSLYVASSLVVRPWILRSPRVRSATRTGVWLLRSRLRRPVPSKPSTSADLAAPSPSPVRSFGILSIAVDPAARRSAIGRRLMERAESAAVSGHFDQMRLTVRSENTSAIGFYRRLGWIEQGRTAEILTMVKRLRRNSG